MDNGCLAVFSKGSGLLMPCCGSQAGARCIQKRPEFIQ